MIFCPCAPTHSLQTHQKISEFTGPKFTKFLQDGSLRVKVSHPLCDPPNSCPVPAYKMNEGCHYSLTRDTNLLP